MIPHRCFGQSGAHWMRCSSNGRGLLVRLSIWVIVSVALFLVPVTYARGGPQPGAQIWAEPGQMPEQSDGWFATLESAHMPFGRLFLMWTDVETSADKWDFSLYDDAFRFAFKEQFT